MQSRTTQLWEQQDRHPGDRWRLFRAVAGAVGAERVLYPGSFVDLAPAFCFRRVIFADTDRRAAEFFADHDGVAEIIAAHEGAPSPPDVRFLHTDFSRPLDLPDEHVDLLVSLYAGFVSEHCTRYLRIGGTLLVNPSHGDAAMASIDRRYRLTGVVLARSGGYRVQDDDIDGFLVPRRPVDLTPELLHQRARGIGYTRSAFAYLFERVA